MNLCLICKKNKLSKDYKELDNDINKVCESCYNINKFCIKCMINLLHKESAFCNACEDLYNNDFYTCRHCKTFECYADGDEPEYRCLNNRVVSYKDFELNYYRLIKGYTENLKNNKK